MPLSMPEKGPLSTSTRRLVAINFLQQLGFQSTYFVGIIGCAVGLKLATAPPERTPAAPPAALEN